MSSGTGSRRPSVLYQAAFPCIFAASKNLKTKKSSVLWFFDSQTLTCISIEREMPKSQKTFLCFGFYLILVVDVILKRHLFNLVNNFYFFVFLFVTWTENAMKSLLFLILVNYLRIFLLSSHIRLCTHLFSQEIPMPNICPKSMYFKFFNNLIIKKIRELLSVSCQFCE